MLWAKFVGGPSAASWAVRQWAEQHQVRVEVGAWRFDLTDTVIEARNVSIQPLRRRAERGDRESYSVFRYQHLADIGKLEIDFGLDYGFGGWLTLAPARHLLTRDPALLDNLEIFQVWLSHVRVNVEKRLPAHGNWDGVLAAVRQNSRRQQLSRPPGRNLRARDGAARDMGQGEAIFELPTPRVIGASDMDVVWIHQFHIGSGEGSIRRGEQIFNMRVEELEILNDLVPPAAGSRFGLPGASSSVPATFRMDGSLGEGLLQAEGSLEPASPPTAEVEVYFDGVALASLWRDQFGISPIGGRFTGVANMEFTWDSDEFQGRLVGSTEDLEYAPRPQILHASTDRLALAEELATLPPRVEIDTSFSAPNREVFDSFQRSFGSATLADKPAARAQFAGAGGDPEAGAALTHGQRIVRELAAEGGRRVARAVGESLGSGVGEATGDATEALLLGDGGAGRSADSPPAGGQETVAANDPGETGGEVKKGNAFTRGMKKMGRGVKRVFTGKRKGQQQEASPETGDGEAPTDAGERDRASDPVEPESPPLDGW